MAEIINQYQTPKAYIAKNCLDKNVPTRLSALLGNITNKSVRKTGDAKKGNEKEGRTDIGKNLSQCQSP